MPSLTAPDLTKFERPKLDLPDIDLSTIELPTMEDVGKAVAGAATSVGLMERPRPRWPYLLGAGLVIGLGAWAYMNMTLIRERLGGAAAWASHKVTSVAGGPAEEEEAIAFPASEPAGAEDYPNGFGAPADMATTSMEDVLALDKVTAKR